MAGERSWQKEPSNTGYTGGETVLPGVFIWAEMFWYFDPRRNF